MRRLIKLLFIAAAIFIVLGLDPRLQTTSYEYSSPKVPLSFDGFTIVQLSDFHLKKFGNRQDALIRAVQNCQPDIIVLTGDVVDGNHRDIAPLADLLEGICPIAPVYYISGNHDRETDAFLMRREMERLFDSWGVVNLDDQSEELVRDNDSILLTGLGWHSRYFGQYLEPADTDRFNILLYHGSDFFPGLAPYGYDLILAGHIHGGIVRLPFVGGVFSNDGSLFPYYDAGAFQLGDSTMISSRGLGDARIPRFYNRPEVVSVTLHAKTSE